MIRIRLHLWGRIFVSQNLTKSIMKFWNRHKINIIIIAIMLTIIASAFIIRDAFSYAMPDEGGEIRISYDGKMIATYSLLENQHFGIVIGSNKEVYFITLGDSENINDAINNHIYESDIENSNVESNAFKMDDIEYEFNEVIIQDGSARIISSNCNDYTCIKMGSISKNGQSIICLPHRLIITAYNKQESEFDAISG